MAYITGPMFFGNTAVLKNRFATLPSHTLILSMRGVTKVDVSGLRLLEQLQERMTKSGGVLLCAAVQNQVKTMFDRGGLTASMGASSFFFGAPTRP